MYFYVFIQPEVFDEALADGTDATQNICNIFSAFEQNCFLAVFEDNRWNVNVKEFLSLWPDTLTRRRIKTLLVHLKKHKRFLYCLTPDYLSVRSDLDCVFQQTSAKDLDLLLVVDSEGARTAPAGTEVATRHNYTYTNFEVKRSAIALHGKTCMPDDMDEGAFLDFHFRKALQYATSIQICDCVCGTTNFKDNFRYTTRRLLEWLEDLLQEPNKCNIVFHMGKPAGQGDQFILREISSYKNGRLTGTSFEVRFYDQALAGSRLPHQRFVLTDQVALDIDRGLDFLDQSTRKCRDTYINYQDSRVARRMLDRYPSSTYSSHRV